MGTIPLQDAYRQERKAARKAQEKNILTKYFSVKKQLENSVKFKGSSTPEKNNIVKNTCDNKFIYVTILSKNSSNEQEMLHILSLDYDYDYDNNESYPVHHSYLSNGKKVLGAGTMEFSYGRLRIISNDSGHYKPRPDQMLDLLERLFLETKDPSILFEDHSRVAKTGCVYSYEIGKILEHKDQIKHSKSCYGITPSKTHIVNKKLVAETGSTDNSDKENKNGYTYNYQITSHFFAGKTTASPLFKLDKPAPRKSPPSSPQKSSSPQKPCRSPIKGMRAHGIFADITNNKDSRVDTTGLPKQPLFNSSFMC